MRMIRCRRAYFGGLVILLVVGACILSLRMLKYEKSEWTFGWAIEPRNKNVMRMGNWPMSPKDNVGYSLAELLSPPNRARMMAEFFDKWACYSWENKDVYDAFESISYKIRRMHTQEVITITVRCASKEVADIVLDEVKSRLVAMLDSDRILTAAE